MNIEQRISEMISPALQKKGFEVVRILIQGSKRKTLQIMIETLDGRNITVEDCSNVSRIVSILLEVDDPIHEPYILEISSPGLDRPLVKLKDYERFLGSMVKIELKAPYEGSRRFQGKLLGIEGDQVKLELDPKNEIGSFAFSDIKKAKLVPDYEIAKSD